MENSFELEESDTTCAICFAEFLEPEDLKLHVEQVHLTEVSKRRYCHFCSSIFSSLENYAFHLRDVHLASLKCCKYCFRTFTDQATHRKHEAKHYLYVKKSYYACSQCKQHFSHVYELEMHEVKYHKDVDDGVMLHDVYPLLTSVLNMKAVVVLQNQNTTLYTCHNCNYSNSNLSLYISHLQKKKCRTLVCDGCSNMYKNRKGLVYHFKTNKVCRDYVTDKHKTVKCVSCKKDVEHPLLKIHMQYCKPAKCKICDAVFDTVEKYSQHQSTEHPLAVSLTCCDFCHKEFVGNVSLQKHIQRVHSPDFHLYKYTCVYCEKPNLYKHPKSLFAHFFTKHANLLPYSCKICDRSFRVRKKFTIHIKLDHKSIGFVEFDEKYNVFFTDKKSESPFQPHCLIDESLLQSVVNRDKQLNKSDAPDNFETTDQETDVEKLENDTETMPVKLRNKPTKSTVNTVNMESDFMQSATEAEGNQTEGNNTDEESLLTACKQKIKPKTKKKKPKNDESDMEIEFLESDDEPLIAFKKKTQIKHRPNYELKSNRFNQVRKDNKKRFTCNICKKYCYTFQNYNYHVSTHFKNETKTCIKCAKSFMSNTELDRHVKKEHGSSKLTETLKNLLERRRRGCNDVTKDTNSELFQRTIKKYKPDRFYSRSSVKITEQKEESAKNFLETFIPDEVNKQEKIEVESSVTIKPVNSFKKVPSIKITKFIPKPYLYGSSKLKMPVRYKQHSYFEIPKVNIKMVSFTDEAEGSYNTYDDSYVDFDDTGENVDQKQMVVPDVAHEVMLENTEEQKATSNIIPHKLVLPKLPMQSKEQIRIAHLLPQAPYFKIVKVRDLMDSNKKPQKTTEPEENEEITLPSGTKLVNVNPLAHLLGETPVDKLPGLTRCKYYKPKTVNFQNAIAKAMLQLNTPKPKKKKTASGEEPTAMEVEQ